MKIAFLISSLNKGGAERTLVNLAEHFNQKGHEILVVTQYKREHEYEISSDIRRIFSEITEEEMKENRIANFVKRVQKLRNIWKREKPDIVLSFIGKNNFMAIATTIGLKTSVSVSVAGDPYEEYATVAMRLLAKTLFCKADGVILKTNDAKDFFPKTIQKKCVVMKNSLNPLFLRAPYQGEREKTIISVGRIDENKNQKMIINAFAKIAKKYPDYRLILYGEGDMRQELIRYLEELGLSDRISLPGVITEVAETIYKAGVFVLSSNSEGMPNALIEAMALGIASISTDCPCGGPKDIIKQEENGILVPIKDSQALARALDKILANPDFAKKLGNNATKMQEDLHPDKTNRAWENYFISKVK